LVNKKLKITQYLFFFSILYFGLYSYLFPQSYQNLKFSRLSVADGISQSTVNAVLQDSYGFIWFGTQDGLNRYDGYNFKIYKHIPNDSSSLSENWIWTIYEDSKGKLWIGTFGGGICSFDRKSETFTTYRNDKDNPNSLSHNTVWNFYESTDGNLWIGTNNGLNYYDRTKKKFKNYQPEKESLIFRIIPQRNNTLLLTTLEKVLIFDIKSKIFKNFASHINSKILVQNIQKNICYDPSGIVWMASLEGEILKYNSTNNNLKKYRLFSQTASSNKANKKISGIAVDKYGFVWVTTSDGLFIMTFSGENLLKVHKFYNDPTNDKSISGDFLSGIHTTKGGEIWISSRNAINRFDQNNQKFLHYNSSNKNINSLSHNGVLPILTSKHKPGIVWIGTRKGLNKYDERNNTFTHFKSNRINPDEGLSSDYILSLFEDKKGNLWVGTRGGGLNKIEFNISGNTNYTHYRYNLDDSLSISSNNVHSIYEDSKGIFWIGTGGGGLNQFNPKSNNFKRYSGYTGNINDINDPWVYNILEDQLGNIWIGTAAGGLNLFNRKDGTFKYYLNKADDPTSISNNRVLVIFETRNGQIWIGTAMGLNKLIPPQKEDGEYSFRQYFLSDGLPNDVIYGILEDDFENLWVSTNKGLCKIHLENELLKVRNYHISDGLQSDEFDQNSFSKDVFGRMYFGGINGFNVFQPDSIKDNDFIPPVVITDLKILNESVPIINQHRSTLHKNFKKGNSNYTGSVFLNKSITLTDTIELAYNDEVLSFEFASLNYTVPEQNKYAYFMEGFDTDWIYSGTRRFVTYTNLDPGKYIFHIKGSNNDGIWNEKGESITLIISPPPWKTWWAYLIYFALFVGAVFIFIKNREKKLAHEIELKLKIEEAKIEERENVRKKISQDFHDEAGNKLTKIALFTELSKRESNVNLKLKDFLNHIEDNTTELSNGMRDFLWVLDVGKDSLFDMIKRIEEFGNSMFEFTDISFTVICENKIFEKILLSMEVRRTIILIFKEAMNNALKYSDAKHISLEIILNENLLTVILTDDGRGFETTLTSNGYGMKNIKSRAEKIGGKTLIESKKNKGTKITFIGNITHMGN